MSKPREFWIFFDKINHEILATYESCVKNKNESFYVLHAREVDPARETLFDEMLEALREHIHLFEVYVMQDMSANELKKNLDPDIYTATMLRWKKLNDLLEKAEGKL